jgi:Zn-dependent metalloprotease
MKIKSGFLNKLVTILVLVSLSSQSVAFAQAPAPQDKLRIGYNETTGKVSFIGADPSRPIAIRSAQAPGLKADSRALLMIAPYAADFGLKKPSSELKLISADQTKGRELTRFQQVYKGIPVMGGEMIVNANSSAELLSLSGEISPNLSLNIEPSISLEQAQAIALKLMAKSHQVSVDAFEATKPELWIYDSRLLEPDGTPAALVWRLEVKSTDNSLPINDLVLVDAQRGNIVLNFNQIDTSWASGDAGAAANPVSPAQDEQPTVTPTPQVTETPVPENTEIATPTSEGQILSQANDVDALATAYYVNIASGNDGNTCTTSASPCQHIQQAIEKGSAAGDTIYVASGTYNWSNSALHPGFSNVVIIDRSITLSGGWNPSFSTQGGVSIIDGQNANNDILANSGTTTIENFIIQNGNSGNGGGIYIYNSNLTLNKTTLKNNVTPGQGAGIFISSNLITLALINSTISGNGNSGTDNGGGIYANNGNVTIQNSTIVYNTSINGGGLDRTTATYNIINSIIANNTVTSSGPDCRGTVATASYSIIEDLSGCTITTASNTLNVDPQIDASLTGTMQVHSLQLGSPAINAGTSSGCPVSDERGVLRPQGTSCDIGAYEYDTPGIAALIQVSSGSPQNAAVSTGFGSPLVAIVKDANGLPVSGVTVTFTAPASGASGSFTDTTNNVTTAITNGSGIATASVFTADATTGSYIVAATVPGVVTPADFQLQNYVLVPTTISINSGSPQAAPLNIAYTSPFRALVRDQFSNPVQGVTVTFTGPASGAGGVFTSSGTNISTALTDINGIATTTTFTANNTAGSFTVDATVSGIGTPASFLLTNSMAQYVSPTGINGLVCNNIAAPCFTINYAITKATAGDTILVSIGAYTGTGSDVVLINKNVKISGGWNTGFTSQQGRSTIDGQLTRRAVEVSASVNATLERFAVQNGYASIGGGSGILLNSGGTLTLNNSIVSGNSVSGIYNYGTLTLNNSSVSENKGGGIFNSGGLLTLNNSTISGNTSGGTGGGGIFSGGTLNLNNSTVSGNIASFGSGGGIYRSGGTVTLRNSLIAGNSAVGGGPDCIGSINSAGYNLIGSTSGCTFAASTGDLTNVSPNIGSLIGLPGYYPLLAGSPAINAGNPAGCTGSTGILTSDERGALRSGTCDIGAYEYITPGAATIFGYASGSDQGANLGTAFSRPLAVYVLDSQGTPVSGETITFSAPASGASGAFTNSGTNITSAVSNSSGIAAAAVFTANSQFGSYTVVATSAGLTGAATFTLRNGLWYVSSTMGSDSNSCSSPTSPCLSIDGLLSKPGFAAGQKILVAQGNYGSSTVDKTTNISGGWNSNFAIQDGPTTLGHIVINSGTVVRIENANIVGSGYMNGGGIYNSGDLTLKSVAIYNSWAYLQGGGIYQNSGQLNLINVTISSNQAYSNYTGANGGGGIYVNNGVVTISNSTIAQNRASDDDGVASGGGIANPNNQSVAIANSIIVGNISEKSPDCTGLINSGGHNLIGTSTDCIIVPQTGDKFGPLNPTAIAMLGDLQYNSGITKTHALTPGSFALDTGNPATCQPEDQRGISRPQGAVCDMGAFEGSIVQTPTAHIRTYTASNTSLTLYYFRCDETDPTCAGGAGDSHVINAHKFAIGTYNFYLLKHNRQSIDNNNMAILSTARYQSGYDNAFWNGDQMIYGDANGYPMADDVVAHELTHGVTQYESGLFYYYQSGAINESFSDVWGEYYDQTNGLGNDTPGVKWLIGEDVTGVGALRSMNNPPAYGDPDKMTSANYYTGGLDAGGVHTNSGINNKAVSLMVDGGSFNSKTVTALGWDKTAAIYYEVNTNLLTSGADYSDLYYALYQGCLNLIGGSLGITFSNCQQVLNATDAVEMNSQPVANFNPEATMCSAGQSPNNVFYDNLESGSSNWTFDGQGRWQYGSPYGDYAHSGTKFLYADDYPGAITDTNIRMTSAVVIPANGRLHFAHAYDFENYENDPNFYDGGVLEYSTNGGSIWTDASGLISVNGYTGTLNSSYGNPLAGRAAFAGTSHGYISTRLNLNPLAGQSVMFRWRMGLDNGGSQWGWWLDDVRIYSCAADANPMVTSIVRADADPVPHNSSVHFTVTFSEAVTGVNTADFALTAPGLTGSAITGVSGSGSTYTVTANTGSGNGILRLDLVDNDSITDAFGNRLGGTGLVNGDYTSSQYYSVYFTPPIVLSMVRANANPVIQNSDVDFTITFSGVVTGVSVDDFVITTGGLASPVISNLSGSGAIYTVTANTGPGDGTLRLDLVDDDSISDGYGTKLGGTGLVNGNYSTGPYYTVYSAAPPTFMDVPASHLYAEDIEILYANGLTAGCSTSPLNFCPDQIMDRAQSAVFNLRGSFGTSYTPPLAPWDRFADDWSAGAWAERWAEGMWNAGLTAGCATSPLRYCPWDQTPKAQAAVFGLRLKYGNSYVPPAASGTVFADMTNTAYFGTKWAEQAYADGLLPDCGTDIGSGKPLFCPNDLVSRGLGAYMIVRAKNLTMP